MTEYSTTYLYVSGSVEETPILRCRNLRLKPREAQIDGVSANEPVFSLCVQSHDPPRFLEGRGVGEHSISPYGELAMISSTALDSGRLLELLREPPLVGRDAEVLRVQAHVTGEDPSSPSALLIRGESGVGKTRLIRAAMQFAREKGVRVFHGRAFPLDCGLSYAVLADAFVPFLQGSETHALEALTRGRLPELLNLFPPAAEGGAPPDLSGSGSPEDMRAALFWSFSELLRGLGKREPVLLVVEDLQWADPSAIQLLHFAIRQIEGHPVRVLCSSTEGLREGNPALLDFEASLRGARLAVGLDLEPLGEEAVAQLVGRVFSVSEETCREFSIRLHEWTGGSPLFVTETLRSLVENGHLRLRDGCWSGWEIEEFEAPKGVQDLVASRLARLSQPAQRMAEVAATMGDRLRFAVMASVAGVPDQDGLDALDELRIRGILEEVRGDADVPLGFTHPLIRECVYNRIGAARARMLHREVGDALEAEDPEGIADRAEELAYHFHRSGDHAPVGKAVQYLIIAGRRALDRHADQEAAHHLEAALHVVDRGDSERTQDREPWAVVVDLARALERTGRYAEAIERWKQVLRQFHESKDGPNPAEIRRRLGLACFRSGRHAEALAHYEAGLAAANKQPLLRGRIQLARAHTLLELARWDEAANDANAALALARQHHDAATQTRAHQALALHDMWTGRTSEARAHAWEAIEGATASSDLSGAFICHWGLALLEGLTGNLEEMRVRIAEARRLAEALHSPILELWTDELSLQEAHARGDWNTAVLMGEQALSRARALGQRTLLPRLLVWTALPVLGRGDLPRGKALVEEAWELAGLNDPVRLGNTMDFHAAIPAFIGRVSLHLAEGDIPLAIAAGEEGLEMASRSGSAIWRIHHLIPLLAQAYMWAGDLEGAQRVSQRLRRESERMDHLLGLAWADACDALVTWLSGDIEGGSIRLRAAADRLEGIPMVFDAARLRRQLAGRLAELGRTAEALSELRRAHSIFRDLGAEPELEKTREMFRELEMRPPPKSLSHGVGGLTGREFEVARLVASRHSNKAIAKELGISLRTVTTHLTNIYGKMDVGSRGELVDLVRERGWVSES